MSYYLKEFYDCLKVEKEYWLISLLLALIFCGALIFLTLGSVIRPFIYTLF